MIAAQVQVSGHNIGHSHNRNQHHTRTLIGFGEVLSLPVTVTASSSTTSRSMADCPRPKQLLVQQNTLHRASATSASRQLVVTHHDSARPHTCKPARLHTLLIATPTVATSPALLHDSGGNAPTPTSCKHHHSFQLSTTAFRRDTLPVPSHIHLHNSLNILITYVSPFNVLMVDGMVSFS